MDSIGNISFRIQLQNVAGEFDAHPDTTLLANMESQGVALIPVGCRGGGCGLCRIQVLQGDYDCKRMSRAHISEHDEAQGRVLACRIFARSDLLIRVETLDTRPANDAGRKQ